MKRFESLFPPLLFGAFAAALVGALVDRLVDPAGAPATGFAVALLAGYFCWMGTEARVTFARASAGAVAADRGTVRLYGGARLVTVVTALYVPASWSPGGGWPWLALALFVAGVALRWWAVRTLGAMYSHRVRTLPQHRVVSSGPYRAVRHPAYLGMIVAHAGVVLLFASPAAVAALVLALVPAIVRRIRVEEAVLGGLTGYPAYAARHARLVPLVW